MEAKDKDQINFLIVVACYNYICDPEIPWRRKGPIVSELGHRGCLKEEMLDCLINSDSEFYRC